MTDPHEALTSPISADGPLLDPARAEPLYRQLRMRLEQAIAAGTYDGGRPLPSSRYLSSALGLSRNTVNLAYQELIAQGIVESRPRSGLYPTDRLSRHAEMEVPGGEPATGGRPEWAELLRRPNETDLAHMVKEVDWQRQPYPFLGGQLDVGLFPVRAWLHALAEALDPPHIHHSLRDSLDQDDPLLVEALCNEILPSRGIRALRDQVLVTTGSQQGLFLVAEALLGPGRTAAVENPGYRDAWHIFLRSGATLLPIPVDASGAVVNQAPTDATVVYVTPSHHHPTNVTLSLARRHQLLEHAAAHDLVVVEDDYDSEFRYWGRPSPSLKSLDAHGRVLYLGTFSKFLAPGLRMGFIVGDGELIAALRDRRRYIIRHPPGHVQRALALFIASGEYHRALRTHRVHMKRKWERTQEAITTYMPWSTTLPATGGTSIWVTGGPTLDGDAVTRSAARYGVLVEAGSQFFLGPDEPRNNLRIGFAAITERAIPRGIEILGHVADEILRTGRSA